MSNKKIFLSILSVSAVIILTPILLFVVYYNVTKPTIDRNSSSLYVYTDSKFGYKFSFDPQQYEIEYYFMAPIFNPGKVTLVSKNNPDRKIYFGYKDSHFNYDSNAAFQLEDLVDLKSYVEEIEIPYEQSCCNLVEYTLDSFELGQNTGIVLKGYKSDIDKYFTQYYLTNYTADESGNVWVYYILQVNDDESANRDDEIVLNFEIL